MSGESGGSLPNNAMVRPIGLGMGPLELRFRTPHTPKTHTPRLFKGLLSRERRGYAKVPNRDSPE